MNDCLVHWSDDKRCLARQTEVYGLLRSEGDGTLVSRRALRLMGDDMEVADSSQSEAILRTNLLNSP